MKAFLTQTKNEFEEIEKWFTEAEEQFKQLAVLYGEDPKTTPEEFFSSLGKFLTAYLFPSQG